MRRILVLLFSLVFSFGAAQASWGWDPDQQSNSLREAAHAVENFKAEDPSLAHFFHKALAWAVYPNVGKVGFWVGGAYGKGVVYERGKAIGFSELKQISVGLQFGGQSYAEIIFFRDKAALARFQTGQLEFDGQISAVAANKGAAANVDFRKGVAVFTLPKGGLMAEASVGGQSFTFTPKK